MADVAAVLVGINKYPNPKHVLRGSVNDILYMKKILVDNYKVDPANIRLLLDERATAKAIRERLHWLTVQQRKNLLFYYSGHGSQVRNKSEDYEKDHMDEILCPVDFDWDPEHYILDDEIDAFAATVPADQRFILVTDACHSGSMYRALAPSVEYKVKCIPAPFEEELQLRGVSSSHWFLDGLIDFFTHWSHKKPKKLRDNVVALSACKDDEVSADTYFPGASNGYYDGRFQGAFSFFFQYALLHSETQTLPDIIHTTKKLLRRYMYPQTPVYTGKKDETLFM